MIKKYLNSRKMGYEKQKTREKPNGISRVFKMLVNSCSLHDLEVSRRHLVSC